MDEQAAASDNAKYLKTYLSGCTGPASNGIDLGTRALKKADATGADISIASRAVDPSLVATLEAAFSDQYDLDVIALTVWSILLCRYAGESGVYFGYVRGDNDRNGTSKAIRPVPVRISLDRTDLGDSWLADIGNHIAAANAAGIFDRNADPGDQDESPNFSSVVFGDGSHDRAGQFSAMVKSGVLGLAEPALGFSIERSDEETLQLTVVSSAAEVERTLDRILEHCENLLSVLLREPESVVAKWPLLSAAEYQQVVIENNATGIEYQESFVVHERIERRAIEESDRVALTFGDKSLTYGELNSLANKLALYLRRNGVEDESLVGVCMERSIEMVVSLVAILKAGGAYVPLDPTYPKSRLDAMLEDADVPVLLTQHKLLELSEGSDAQVVAVDRIWDQISEYSAENPEHGVKPDQLAYVIFTSGSTGRPKGAMNNHRGICNRLYWMQEQYGLTPDDVVLQKTPFSFDVSVWEFFWPLMIGAQLTVAKPEGHKDRTYLANLIVSAGVTTMHFVPSMLQVFLGEEDVGRCSSSLKRVICSGEALSYALKEDFFSLIDAELHNLYGPTEAAVDVTYWECKPEPDATPVPIGRPVANTQIYVLDVDLNPMPFGVAGELHIGGVQVGRGYLNRGELTEEKFIKDPLSNETSARLYKTGDLARIREDGVVEYLGRIDHQVKIRGLRIELGEIESVMEQYDGVQETVVTVREDGEMDKRLVAYLVPVRDHEVVGQESDERVEQVQTIFDQTYFQDAASVDPTLNIVGWNSSYTGEPIPEAQMRFWVESTVDRILALNPKRVLEIGCGTGMLLFRVAPSCDSYTGADFSHVVLQQLRGLLAQPEFALPNVELMQRPADDYTGIAKNAFDTIVINSVIQLFPSLDYLIEVIEGALEHIVDGGKLFIGDVRSLDHLLAYHASVELFRSQDSVSSEQLLERIKRKAELEEELLIDPQFFYALHQRFPQISGVNIELKRGDFQNELTRFRYDVTITVNGEAATKRASATMEWGESCLAEASSLLSNGLGEAVEIIGIPNARLQRESAALRVLQGDSPQISVSDLRKVLDDRARTTAGLEPEELWSMADEHGYVAQIRWSRMRGFDAMDVLLAKAESAEAYGFSDDPATDVVSWDSFANEPLKGIQARSLVPDLRAHLRDVLPDYMVPSAFVVLDAFPLSPNGKIDRKALPAPDYGQPDISTDYEAPRNDTERTLCDVWCDVLGLEKVGIRDNFFDVGGDSILNIQVVSRAAKQGIRLTPLQLFKHQTVAELADAAMSGVVAQAEQGAIEGEQFLSPMQHWVIDHAPVSVDHSNQLLLFRSSRRLDSNIAASAVEQLTQQHDALRLELEVADGETTARYGSEVGIGNFEHVVVESSTSEEDVEKAFMDQARLQSTRTSVSSGNLWSVVLIEHQSGCGSAVLFCLHHLVVDGYSGKLIAEDFAKAYRQIENGDSQGAVADKTTSFKAAGTRMSEYASSDVLMMEAGYWQAQGEKEAGALPFDFDKGADDEQSERTVCSTLSEEVTHLLLRDGSKKYRASAYEILITALARVLSEWTSHNSVRIETESHGREEIFEEFDLSRTAGVFASMFPVVIDIDPRAEVGESIRSVKSQFRAVPVRGMGFGYLKYVSGDQGAQTFAGLKSAPVLFNYLGHYDLSEAQAEMFDGGFWLDTSDRSPSEVRTHSLDVLTRVTAGELHIQWTYSANRFERQSIESLSKKFIGELNRIAASASELNESDVQLTTSDFPAADLTESELRKILDRVSAVEKIYPLAPLQEGMLFHALVEPDSDTYYVQLNGRLDRDLDVDLFARAWQRLVEKYDIYRTRFVSDGLSRAMQVVSRTVEMTFEVIDARNMEPKQQEETVAEFRQDRRASYDLDSAPLMGVRLLQFSEHYHLFWNFHHLLLDGTSMVATVEELFEVYRDLVANSESKSEAAEIQFSDFVDWRESQSDEAAREYWTSRLGSFNNPTELPMKAGAAQRSRASGGFKKRRFRLTAEEGATFLKAAREQRVTPNTMVHAAWGLLLGNGADSGSAVFGTVVPGRQPSLDGAESVIGMCMNTLPVSIEFPAQARVSEWLQQIQDDLLKMRDFDFSPLVDIQRCSGVEAGVQMFNSVIAVQGYLGRHSSLEGWGESLGIRGLEFIDWNDLELSLAVEVGDTLDVLIKYSSSAYSDEGIEILETGLRGLLISLSNVSNTTVQELIGDYSESQKKVVEARNQKKQESQVKRLRKVRRKSVTD